MFALLAAAFFAFGFVSVIGIQTHGPVIGLGWALAAANLSALLVAVYIAFKN